MRHQGAIQRWLGVLLVTLVSFSLASPIIPTRSVQARKTFELTLTWEVYAPDGRAREMILVNGQFPGPTLEIDQGDEVEVIVHNNLPYNSTVHFHGITMALTPWSDGVPGLTQRHIQPGRSFNYKWTATQYGSHWYHAHQLGQLDDGLYGAIIIHPKNQPKPFSLITADEKSLRAIEMAAAHPQPLLLGDFRHTTSYEIHRITREADIELTCYDSILFNGKGSVECWSPEKINSLLTPQQRGILQAGGATNFTPKGCIPPEVIADVLAAGKETDVSAIPPEIFDVCIPSTGPKEVISVNRTKCEKRKWVAIEVIGVFGLLTTSFSIDELPMYVYAVDGEYIEPQLVHAITVTNGDRYSVLIDLTNAQPGDYPIRAASVSTVQLMAATATLSYHIENTDKAPITDTTPYILDNGLAASPATVFFSQLAQRQFNPTETLPPPGSYSPAATYKLIMRISGNTYEWALNTTSLPSYHTDAHTNNLPVLLFDPEPYRMDNHTITTTNNTYIDLIFISATAQQPAHPIHKHGNKMFLLGYGAGTFPWASVEEAMGEVPQAFNLVDPPHRDGFATRPAGTGPQWMAVRYHVSQPGAWLLHCHIQGHLLGGMSVIIQDGIDAWPTVPQEYLEYA
ncbi:Multicopper oxidase [Madurella fahalii]|uniref:Multicopper oxidase n=1 Tax=Madurella fahalii TaxID=1157608 RepID=A0ABQ0GBW0_9PEZI